MCTSFVTRSADMLVARNFENNGKPWELQTKSPGQFMVLVSTGRGKYPSFGINRDGTFINNLCVDSNGKGQYKRAGKTVTHTSKLTSDILTGVIGPDEIGYYLSGMEVVNTPDASVHNMIADRSGNIWIVEPGRGILHSNAKETPYELMTNFSLCDMERQGGPYGDGANRYQRVKAMLDSNPKPYVTEAFEMLKSVMQSGEDWTTEFSMVYSPAAHTVYYCMFGQFRNILSYSF